MQVNMHEAKSKLSQLVDAALSGEPVTIARTGRPVAKLVALSDSDEQPIFGALKGWGRLLESAYRLPMRNASSVQCHLLKSPSSTRLGSCHCLAVWSA